MTSGHLDAHSTTSPRQVLDVHGEPVSPQTTHAGCGIVGMIIAAVVLIVLGVGGFFVAKRLLSARTTTTTSHKSGSGSIPVSVIQARRGSFDLFIEGLGTVTPLNTVTVKSRVDGQIMKVAYTDGQFVKEGQLLVEVDPRPYQVQLEQAQGQLLKDQAQRDEAQLDLNRYQSIPNSVTQQQIDQQKALVQQYVGAVESDQSAVDNAKLNLVYCQITAPFDGRIGIRLVDVGNIVHASDTTGVAVITQIQPITVIVPVTEDQVSSVFKRPDHGQGLSVDAYTSDKREKIATGKLMAIDNQIDPGTGTVKIEASFDNKDNALFPGQFVNAKLLVDTLQNVVLVPSSAVQLGPESSYVYIVEADKTVHLQNVTVDPRVKGPEGSETVIQQGVEPGQSIVTVGIDKLTQGTKVTIAAPGSGKGGATTQPVRGHRANIAASQPNATSESEGG